MSYDISYDCLFRMIFRMIVIVFSQFSSARNLSVPYSSFLYPRRLLQRIPFLLVYFTFSRSGDFTLFCAVTGKRISVRPLPLPPDYWNTFLFVLGDLDPLHEIAVSAFSRSPLDRENKPLFLYLVYLEQKVFFTFHPWF